MNSTSSKKLRLQYLKSGLAPWAIARVCLTDAGSVRDLAYQIWLLWDGGRDGCAYRAVRRDDERATRMRRQRERTAPKWAERLQNERLLNRSSLKAPCTNTRLQVLLGFNSVSVCFSAGHRATTSHIALSAGVDNSRMTRVAGPRLSNLEWQHTVTPSGRFISLLMSPVGSRIEAQSLSASALLIRIVDLVLVSAQSRDDARATKNIWSPMLSSCRESQPAAAGPVGVQLQPTQFHHRVSAPSKNDTMHAARSIGLIARALLGRHTAVPMSGTGSPLEPGANLATGPQETM